MTSLKQQLNASKTDMSKIASEIQKMAADVGEGHGTLGPDQVKEILTAAGAKFQEASQLLGKAMDGIPSSESEGDETEENPEDDTMIASDDDKGSYGLESEHEPKTFKSKKATEQGNRKLLEEVATLSATVKSLVDQNTQLEKAKIAKEFSEHFPQAVRQAKYDEMINSKEDIKILSARLDTIKSLSQTKVASRIDITRLEPTQVSVFGKTLQRDASMGKNGEQDLVLEAV